MTSRCYILEAAVRRPSKYGPSTLEVWPVGPRSNMPEGLEEKTSLVRDFQLLSDINQTNPYTQWRDSPIPVVTQAVQLLFGGLTVTPIPYRPIS